jgi:hypothetical protein
MVKKRCLHFWELSNKCRFYLNPDFWSDHTTYRKDNIRKNSSYNLNQIKIICNCNSISLIDIEKYIEKASYNLNGKSISVKFPIDFLNEEWAGFVGALLAEGDINQSGGVGFWNVDKEVISKFVTLVNRLFSNSIKYSTYKNAYYCLFPSIIGQILISGLEMKTGPKVKTDPEIPRIYRDRDISKEKNKRIVSSLLSWLFTGDGWVSLFKDHLGKTQRHMGIGFSIISKNSPPKLLKDTHYLISKFAIKPQKIYFDTKKEYYKKGKKEITESWKFFIHGKENFELFQKNIDFKDTRRKDILQEAIQSFVKPNLRKGEPLIRVINAVKQNSPCTKHNVIKDTKLQMKRIEILLKEARTSNLIKVVGGGERKNGCCGGKNPYMYETTPEGIYLLEEKGDKFL